MKSNILILFISIFSLVSLSQENLVPNGDFESGQYNGDLTSFFEKEFILNPTYGDSILLSDSVIPKKEKLFFNPGWKKHNHIVDFYSYIGFIFINLNSPGALGYRYLYSTNWKYAVKFGARTGFWFHKSGEDILEIKSRNSMTYSTFFMVNGPIWKSFNWEASLGYSNSISWPSKNNTFDDKKYYYGSSYWVIKSGINAIYFKHVCLDINFEYIYDALGKSWFPGVSLTVGYKF